MEFDPELARALRQLETYGRYHGFLALISPNHWYKI